MCVAASAFPPRRHTRGNAVASEDCGCEPPIDVAIGKSVSLRFHAAPFGDEVGVLEGDAGAVRYNAATLALTELRHYRRI